MKMVFINRTQVYWLDVINNKKRIGNNTVNYKQKSLREFIKK